MNKKVVESGYFVTYVSTSWKKEVSKAFMGGKEGMIIHFDEKFRQNNKCCDVSWISKFPDECEVLFARSVKSEMEKSYMNLADQPNPEMPILNSMNNSFTHKLSMMTNHQQYRPKLSEYLFGDLFKQRTDRVNIDLENRTNNHFRCVVLDESNGIQTCSLTISLQCPGRHQLKDFHISTDESIHGCDGCGKEVSANTRLWGCRICNYDLCVECYGSN